MSAGVPTEYAGVSGIADSGGDSLTEDLNIYYSVCFFLALRCAGPTIQWARANQFPRMATSPGS